jgi:hypothetical protein
MQITEKPHKLAPPPQSLIGLFGLGRLTPLNFKGQIGYQATEEQAKEIVTRMAESCR